MIHCREKRPTCSVLFIGFHAVSISCFLLLSFRFSFLLAQSWIMTKRDSSSSSANLDCPRVPMSFPRRHFAIRLQSGSGQMVLLHRQMQCCSGHPKRSLLKDLMKQERLLKPTALDIRQRSLQLPSTSPGPPGEAYPLQSEMSQNHRVLHTHIFKEVLSPNRLMATESEVDRYGVERNCQAEFFFNGIVGHVRSYDGGHINSWEQAPRLANYWRRFYNIPEVHDGNTSWTSSWQDHQQSTDNADNTAGTYGEQPESDMEDDTSVTVETGTVSIPSQVHQLASVLHNILLSDREFNAPILEKLETPPADPNANPIQLFTASDLAHLASNLSITSQTLAQHLQNQALEDISEISD